MEGRFPLRVTKSVAHLAGRAVECRVSDPDRVLGFRIRFFLRRQEDFLRGVYTSAIPDNAGRVRFFAWLPDDAFEIDAVTDPATASGVKGDVSVSIDTASVLKILMLMLFHQPKLLFRVGKLWARGNRKGATKRFIQTLKRIGEPSYERWLFAQRKARESLYDPALENRIRVLVTIDEGDPYLISQTRESLGMLNRSDTVEVSISSLRTLISSAMDSSSTLWLKLPPGAILEHDAVDFLRRQFAHDPNVAAIYPDEGGLDSRGRPRQPRFNTEWNLLQSEDGLLSPDSAAIRASYIDVDVDLRSETSEILIQIARRYGPVVQHSPNILLHRKGGGAQLGVSVRSCRSSQSEKVSVVIPTRDHADLLKRCIDGLFETNEGVELEVIVIDNESREEHTRKLLDDYGRTRGVRRLDLPGKFNFARACNLGVLASTNELVLLLNNDVEPLSKNWLRSMIGEAHSPSVGAVGALLLYPDGMVQHAGVTLSNLNVAYHTFQFYDPNSGEDAGMLDSRREVSAVTAACMLTKKSCWEQLGGMDEIGLAVAFNDVDYCLKLRSLGMRVIWTPDAKLTHRESVSRRSAQGPDQILAFKREERLMLKRWHKQLRNDPFRSPNLSLFGDETALESYPRT